MDYVHLGRTGLKVSRLCLGTMNFGPVTSAEDSFAIMDRAHAEGINYFDSANVYGWGENRGLTERIVGDWFAQGGGRREKTVLVRKAKNREGRLIPLTSRAATVLQNLKQVAPPPPIAGSGKVFFDLKASRVSHRLPKAAKLAGITGLRLHDLRHAFGSGLARSGATPGVIGTLLGDKTPAVVFRYSRHAPKDAMRDAVKDLEALRAGKESAAAKTA